jgi:hypothetical protein
MDPENVFQEFVMPDPVEQVDGYPQCAPFARISQVKPKENHSQSKLWTKSLWTSKKIRPSHQKAWRRKLK